MKQTIIYCFLFVLGLILGSFWNVVIYRYQAGISICSPRSHCPHCKIRLSFKDLFPLLSFFLRKGRCRHCEEKISWRYPLVELFSAIILLFCYYYFHLTPLLVKFVLFFYLLLIISCIDLQVHTIPNCFLLMLFGWSILWQVFSPCLPLGSALAGFLIGGGLFYMIAFFSRGGMGGGDIKLMAVLGFTAGGWPSVFLIFLLSFFLGAVVGTALLFWGKKTSKSVIAFAPFLSLSFFLVTFWGEKIWDGTWGSAFKGIFKGIKTIFKVRSSSNDIYRW